MESYTPIEVATALSLYGYNVSPGERAEALYDYFTDRGLGCAEPYELLAICERHKYAATEFAFPTAVVYVNQALNRYGEEARERCRINGDYLPPEFLAALETAKGA